MRLKNSIHAVVASLAWGLVVACGQDTTEQTSVRRGDQAFAEGKYDAALAEYRLAVRQGADDAATLARVAHTYAVLNRVDDAGAFYVDATAKDSSFQDQAVSALMVMAKDARARQDRFAMASAVETAMRLRPGLGVSDMSLDLARHYFQNGEYGRALPFYQKALAEVGDSATSEIVFEVGQAYEEVGDCRHALLYFERFRQMVRPWQRGEVDWYIGTCAFNMARDVRTTHDRTEEDLQAALANIDRTLELGEPRNIQAQAWFEKGNILSDLGECQAAMDAYARVRTADAAGSLVDRAQSLFDEIRFGRGLEDLRGGRCR
ncbi:MAG TPA: tetratricopeptide repeat protein [Longimicrobiales bacterium]|nr:tetratricopeptide repeat protein [Longimicrobiales bacterium]